MSLSSILCNAVDLNLPPGAQSASLYNIPSSSVQIWQEVIIYDECGIQGQKPIFAL